MPVKLGRYFGRLQLPKKAGGHQESPAHTFGAVAALGRTDRIVLLVPSQLSRLPRCSSAQRTKRSPPSLFHVQELVQGTALLP